MLYHFYFDIDRHFLYITSFKNRLYVKTHTFNLVFCLFFAGQSHPSVSHTVQRDNLCISPSCPPGKTRLVSLSHPSRATTKCPLEPWGQLGPPGAWGGDREQGQAPPCRGYPGKIHPGGRGWHQNPPSNRLSWSKKRLKRCKERLRRRKKLVQGE